MPTIEVQAVPVQVQTTQVQPGAFTTDICDCCQDCPTCCAVTWCAPIVLGQLWERLKGPAGSCLKVSLLLWGAYMALSFWSYKDAKSRAEEALEAMRSKPTQAYNSYAPLDEGLPGFNSLLDMCQGILGIIFIVMLAKLRAVVRQRDGSAFREFQPSRTRRRLHPSCSPNAARRVVSPPLSTRSLTSPFPSLPWPRTVSERQCHGCEDCCCSFWCSVSSAAIRRACRHASPALSR